MSRDEHQVLAECIRDYGMVALFGLRCFHFRFLENKLKKKKTKKENNRAITVLP